MTLEVWNTIFLGIIAFFFLAMTIVLIPVALKVKGAVEQASALTGEARRKLDPVMARVNHITDDVQGMTTTVRREVDRFGVSAEKVAAQVDQMAALAEVIQAEIREPLIKSAATVAGLRRMFGRLF